MYNLVSVLSSAFLFLTISGFFILSAETALAETKLQFKINSGAWQPPPGGSVRINVGDQLSFKWWSTVSVGVCEGRATGGSGGGFSTGDATSGTDTTIIEPAIGYNIHYDVVCYQGTHFSPYKYFDYAYLSFNKAAGQTGEAKPTAKLEQRLGNSGTWSTSDLTINYDEDEDLQLRWSSTNANSCTSRANDNQFSVSSTGGTDTTLSGPSPGSIVDYSIICVNNSSGVGAVADMRVTIPHPPTVNLQQRIGNSGSWSGSNVSFTGNRQVQLKWSSTNARSCSGTGSGFYVNSTSGSDTSITEPTVGNSRTYTVTCDGGGGTGSDSIIVTNVTLPTAALERSIDSGVSWSGSNLSLTGNQQVRLRWSSSNANSCSGSGSGFSASGTSGSDISITEPTAGNSTTYTVTCTGGGGSASDSITVTKPAVPTVTLQQRVYSGGSWSSYRASDVAITGSQQVGLKWTSSNVTSCTHTGGSGFYANATSGTDGGINEPSVGNSRTYSISCSGAGGTVTDSLTVTKPSVPTAALERSIDSGVSWSGSNLSLTGNQQVRLRWSSSNADSCSGSGSGFSASGTSGSDISITEPTAGNSTTYTVTCTGGGGSASDSITVTKPAVPTVTLQQRVYSGGSWSSYRASDVNIVGSEQVGLKWTSSNVTWCTHTGGSGFYANATSGTDGGINEPSVGNSRTYSISCSGAGGTVTDSLTVTKPSVPTVTLQIKAFGSWGTNDVTITETDGIALKWSSTNADSCSGSGSGFSASAVSGTDWSITEPTVGNSETYTVTCTGSGGSASDSITVTKPAVPTVTLQQRVYSGGSWSSYRASDVAITGSQQVGLKWTSSNVTWCTHTGGSGFYANATSGTDGSITEPTVGNSRTYSISCSGAGGTVTDSLTVTKPSVPTVTLQIKAFGSWGTNDVTITETDGIALKWSSTNADSCSGSGFSASAVSGTDWSITEPTVGNSETYTVTCTGSGGSAADSITVTTLAVPTVIMKRRIGYGGNFETGNLAISAGDQVHISWTSTNANRCTGAGRGFGVSSTAGTDDTIKRR